MLKRLRDIDWFQDLVAHLIVGYLRFCYKTTQWQTRGLSEVREVWLSKGPAVYVFWHERLHLGHKAWPYEEAQPLCVLASGSREGEISVKINRLFGHVCVRGSSAKKSDPGKPKGGTTAFLALYRWLISQKAVAMTPDGPRGPRRIMTEGTLVLAQKSNAPLVLLGASTRRYIALKSWDQMRVPLPFGQGALFYEVITPARLTEEADPCLYVQNRLNALIDEADTALGLSLADPA